ncbi:MAG: DUF1501 domain-containing protein [Planctomycetales bacterium]
MLRILGTPTRLCDGLSRREMLRVGGLSALGLGLPQLLGQKNSQLSGAEVLSAPKAKAKSCIVLFLMGGPPQHSTWDPKPHTPPEVRGEFGPIETRTAGVQICELLPRTSLVTDKLAILRAVSSGDNAHSSSGYYMLTGYPHTPMNFENANPGFPNDHPQMAGIVRKFLPSRGSMPASVRLPHRIFNTDGSVWPGQDAGFLGRAADPWLLNCKPADPDFRVGDLNLHVDATEQRLGARRTLLDQVNHKLDLTARSAVVGNYDRLTRQAFDLLYSRASRTAFRLEDERAEVRERYGITQFGQSVLLARRLVEAGVRLVQVNWYRSPEEPMDAPCWDSHIGEAKRLKTVLAPNFDQAFSALIEDLSQRGLLEETLVVSMAEFGRSPRINGVGGRDHWGSVYSVAMAGGGVRGGIVHGASDNLGGQPKEGRVAPQDITATVFHALGLDPRTEMQDTLGRPLPISRGEVIHPVLG